MNPANLWYVSTRLHRGGWHRLARLLKMVNYLAYHAVLPVECTLEEPVTFYHRALAVVIHPQTNIAAGVSIAHSVTLGCAGDPSRCHLVVEDGVTIGAGAVVIAREGVPLVIGRHAVVGANATVVESVPAFTTALPPLATFRPRTSAGERAPRPPGQKP